MKKAIGCVALCWTIFFSYVPSVSAQGFQVTYCNASQTQIRTAIGCIDTTPGGFVNQILIFSIGIAGGIAFLMILLGALQIQTSTGNPERVTQGKEIIEGAITGLLLIIFAVFILRIIGVDILRIPGFS